MCHKINKIKNNNQLPFTYQLLLKTHQNTTYPSSSSSSKQANNSADNILIRGVSVDVDIPFKVIKITKIVFGFVIKNFDCSDFTENARNP